MMRGNNKEKFENKNNIDVSMKSDGRIITDPDGMYTGVPLDDENSKPVQDADDL